MKKPLGVTLISYFYIFGAGVLIITALFYDPNANPIGFAERFGLPYVPERLIRVAVGLISLILAIGYLRLKKWGFWMMIAYAVLFAGVSFGLSLSHHQQPFIGNMLWSILVLFYTIYVKKAFFPNKSSINLA